MSDEKVQERRVQIKKNKMLNSPVELSFQQEKRIQELLFGHRSTFDSAFSRFSSFRVCEWMHAVSALHHHLCFNLCNWSLIFFSLWTETSFLWIRTSRRQASSLTLWPSALETTAALRVNLPPSPHHRHLPPHALHPPPVSTVPLKNKNTTYGMTLKTDVFSLLFRMWPTSRLTWSRTSLAFPKVSKTSSKCVHQRIFIFSRHVFDTWCQNGVLQVSYHGRPNISAEGSHVWNNADPLQHGVQLKNEHMGMWPYYILHRWRCTR